MPATQLPLKLILNEKSDLARICIYLSVSILWKFTVKLRSESKHLNAITAWVNYNYLPDII